jgi:transposase
VLWRSELTTIDAKIRAADKQLRQLVAAHGSSLTDLYGIGPSGAARLLGDIGDIRRFAHRGALRVLERHRPARGVIR